MVKKIKTRKAMTYKVRLDKAVNDAQKMNDAHMLTAHRKTKQQRIDRLERDLAAKSAIINGMQYSETNRLEAQRTDCDRKVIANFFKGVPTDLPEGACAAFISTDAGLIRKIWSVGAAEMLQVVDVLRRNLPINLLPR